VAEFTTFRDLEAFSNEAGAVRAFANARSAAPSRGTDVFLTYSSKDVHYVPGVVLVLVNHGATVYVDQTDNRLPETPSPETAKILRSEIESCRRLVVFVTTNSKDSKWIPWELGVGDGLKTNGRVALFPAAISNYEQQWAGQEYFGLYRRIVWGRIENNEPCWIVYDHHANTAETLTRWLDKPRQY
jgi:hypothetical protein